jgi:short-subunit dehydrogenase
MEKKTILITGGSDGAGKAIATILSKGKNNIIILARDEKKLKATADSLNADYFVCDISDHEQVAETVEKIIKKHHTIDILVNNAGIWMEGELDENKEDEIKKVIETNTLGHIYMTKAAIPYMKKQKSGLIINIISGAGLYGKSERSVYNASKFAMTGFTRSIEPELEKYGIKVSGVFPGKINTKMFEKLGIEKDMTVALQPHDVAKAVEYIINQPKSVIVTELVLKGFKN